MRSCVYTRVNPSSKAPSSPAGPASASPQELQRLCKQWFEAHGTAVYNYFRFHLPLTDVAEDLTAETFLKVVRAAERFDAGQSSPRAWILTVARNVLGDWRRRARPDRELISLRYGSGLEIAEMSEILGVGVGTVRTRLWRALDRLRKVVEP